MLLLLAETPPGRIPNSRTPLARGCIPVHVGVVSVSLRWVQPGTAARQGCRRGKGGVMGVRQGMQRTAAIMSDGPNGPPNARPTLSTQTKRAPSLRSGPDA